MVLIVGMGIGWWLLGKYGLIKRIPASKNRVVENTIIGQPTEMFTDEGGNKLSTVEVIGKNE